MGSMMRESVTSIKNCFLMLLVFGGVQLLFLVQVYYPPAGRTSSSTQCDCQCTKQLHISTGTGGSNPRTQGDVADSVANSGPNKISKTDEKLLKQILNAEDKRLDKEWHRKVYAVNSSRVEDPDERTPYQDEREDKSTTDKKQFPTDLSNLNTSEPAGGHTLLTYRPLKLNAEIDDSRLRCVGDHSNTIIIYVYSAPDHFSERELVRRTWGSVKSFHGKALKVIFFIGALSSSASIHYPAIRNESAVYGDLVQDLSYIDAYRNLTLKGISALQWVRNYCPMPYRVVKVDDDSLVNPYQLIMFLLGQSEETMSEFICRVTKNVGPIRNKKSKYYVSTEEYSSSSYPDYCQGLGYVIPPSLIPRMLSSLTEVNLIAMEDVFFTGIIREKIGANLHALTAMFFTTYTRFDIFLERITSRPELLFIGHVHEEDAASTYWQLIIHRSKSRKK